MESTGVSARVGTASGERYVFAGFELDPGNRVLTREGTEIPLPAKAFDLLVVFVESAGRLLEKDELIARVWRDKFVEEGNLARHVSMLRKALGDDAAERRVLVTVQGRGYRFVAPVSRYPTSRPANAPEAAPTAAPVPSRDRAVRRWRWAVPTALLLLAVTWIASARFRAPEQRIRTLAVLPLRSLGAAESLLGAGIADGVIRRLSQTGALTVRPTSAVLPYLRKEVDSLQAARELGAEAVLEGTLQRVDDRLRVSLNLLRVRDERSLWADTVDVRGSDSFLVQDDVARLVARRLRLELDPAESGRSSRRPTSSNGAYEAYARGIYSLDQRGYGIASLPQMRNTIACFEEAIAADPAYALAHAQLAYAQVWTALFIEPTDPSWARQARAEIARAEELDGDLAETHIAKALLLWSAYEGYQNEAALRELLVAQQLDRGVGHADLAAIAQHVGLENLAARVLAHGLEVDPTSINLRSLRTLLPVLAGDHDAALRAEQTADPHATPGPWYLIGKGRLEEARRALDEALRHEPENPEVLTQQAVLLAATGDFRGAEAKAQGALSKQEHNRPSYHHVTYGMATVFALAGQADEAVRWLRETADTGYPDYPLFARDRFLDPIRRSDVFERFMAQLEARWQADRREFGD